MLALWLIFPALCLGGDEERPTTFDRVSLLGSWEAVLETAIVTYRDPEGIEVSLVAAYHYGDRGYYEVLQRNLDGFEVLLYEGWKKEADATAGAGEDGGPEAAAGGEALDSLIKYANRGVRFFCEEILGAVDQWARIDYGRPRFVNADMTLRTFMRRVRQTGELRAELLAMPSLFRAYLHDVVHRLVHHPSSPGDIRALIRALGAGEGKRVLKYLIVREVGRIIDLPEEAAHEKALKVTLGERNDLVLEAIGEQIRAGRRRIGVFYGAAHMPGLERALVGGLGFRKVGERWIVAWDILEKSRGGLRLPGI
jgi:hypothetical protein